MYSPAVIDREQAALQARLLGVESAGLCDDVENSIGDILCDGLDELEAVLGNEPTVALDGDQIRQVGAVSWPPSSPSLRTPRAACPPCMPLMDAPPPATQSVDKVMYQFQKHSVDNCRVFKRYSLQHIFNIQPQVAERMSRPPAAQSAPVETSGASEAESALDAELEQLRQQAHAVRGHDFHSVFTCRGTRPSAPYSEQQAARCGGSTGACGWGYTPTPASS
jgi:hypothetical protein